MAILSDDEKKKAKQIEEQTKKNTEVPSIKRNANQFTGYSQSALNSLAKGSYGKEHETDQKNRDAINRRNKAKLDRETFAREKISAANNTNKVPELSPKPSSKYSNQNVKSSTMSSKSTRDTSFDKDFDDFYEWRFNKADVTPDYNPLTDTNEPHWKKVKSDIMAKNNWSDKEFESRWKEYNDEKNQQMANEEVDRAIGIAEKSGVLGTLLQGIETPRTWIEGAATAIQGIANTLFPNSKIAQEHTAESSTSPLLTGTRVKEGVKQTVKDEHIDTNFGKTAYDIGTGISDMMMSSAIPVVGPALSGLASGTSNQLHALERGVDSKKASQYGTATGGVSALMNAVGLDKALGAEAKSALGSVGKAALTEGLENVLEDTTNTVVIDSLINKDKSQINEMKNYYVSEQGLSEDDATKQVAKDIARDIAVSGLSGAAFGGLINGARNIDSLAGEIYQKLLYNRNTKNTTIQDILNGENTDVPNSDIPVRNYKDLIPENSYFKNDEFATQMSELKAARARDKGLFDELQSIDKELKQYLDTSETDGDSRIAELLNSYTDKAKPLLERRKQLRAERQNIGGRIAELDANTTSMRDAGRAKELENYQFNSDFKPLSQTEYEGFDITKGTNGDVNDALSNGDAMLVEMSPTEYLQRVAYDIFDTSTLGSTINGIETPDNVAKYADAMRNGEKFPILSLTYDGKYGRGQEGRTRALAAYEAGIDKIPVAIIGEPSANPKNIIPKESSSNIDIDALIDGMDFTDEELGINFSNGNVPRIENDANFRLSDGEPSVPRVNPTEPEIAPNSTVPTVNSDATMTVDNRMPELTVDPEKVDNPGTGKSRVVYNSAINADIITKEELESNVELQKIAEYERHSNVQTFDEAMINVKKNGKQLLKDYSKGTKTIDSDQSVDEAMILLTNLSDKLSRATSEKSIAKISAQRNKLLSQLRQAGTKAGQEIQAFAKWNLTADGALVNGERIVEERVDNWKRSNKKTVKENSRIARALKALFYDGTMDIEKEPLTHDQVKQGVIKAIEKEYGSIEGKFNDDNIEYLTYLAEDTTIPTWQITDEIQHFLDFGEFYTLDESTPMNDVGTNSTFANALDSLTGRETAQKKEISFDELKQQIKNTLDKESASVGNVGDAEITDADVNYFASLIENGASVNEIADVLNRKLATGSVGISAKTQTTVNNLFEYARNYGTDSKEAVEARLAAYKLIADETVGKAEGYQKFEAWRYLAMLGNPKTMVRNFVGNVSTNTITSFSNTLSAAVEGGVDTISKAFGGKGIERRKAILNPIKDKGLIKSSIADADASRYSEVSGTKYEKSVSGTIKGQKSVFDNKLVQLYEKLTDKGISDYLFVKTKYGTSLAGYMKANGMTEADFDAEAKLAKLQEDAKVRKLTDAETADMESLKATVSKLEKGRDYALAQAEYATFHEDNEIADSISRLSQKLNNSDKWASRAFGKVVEGTVPFKKTPANVLKTGVEYSPLGAIKSIAETGKLIYENTGKRKGNLDDTYMRKTITGREFETTRSTASDIIESWSQTLTGSALMAFGAYLFDKGILNSSSDEEKYQDDLEGKQNYSLTVNGKTYTIDWMAPGSMPLLAGAALKRVWDNAGGKAEDFFKDIDSIITSANEVINPLIETSMMEGVQNILESAANEIRYNEGGAVGGILGSVIANAGAGYFTQAVPTLSGQVARTVDNTRRTTDTVSDSAFLSGIEKQGRKIMNKIPGLSYLNTAYRDAYGRTQTNSPFNNPVGNFLYQAISPAYADEINTTKADQYARDVFNATTTDPITGEQVPIKDKDVFASWKSKLTINGEKIKPKELEKYRQISGETNYDIRTALAESDWFNSLNGTQQTEVLKKINTVSDKVGKDALGYEQKGDEYEAYKEGGIPSLMDYMKGTQTNKQIIEQTGLSVSSNAAKTIAEDMNNGNVAEAEQKIAEAQQFSNYDIVGADALFKYYNATKIIPSLSTDEFARIYMDMNTDRKFNDDGTRKNDGITQDEFIDYITRNNLSQEEVDRLYKIFKGNWKRVPSLTKNGWKMVKQ